VAPTHAGRRFSIATIVNFVTAAKLLALNISYDRRSIRFTCAVAKLYA
jgi:hypothetical protein